MTENVFMRLRYTLRALDKSGLYKIDEALPLAQLWQKRGH